ncbi:MAG: (deoxy)nucleoside triphosphate pyrophosphohydrolase [Bilifractor sp.]
METKHVVAAVILHNGKIFATQRGYGAFKDKWEFPGGKIEPVETPQEALAREIREELDTEIEVGELLDTIETDYPTFHLTMGCYLCTVKSGKLTLLEHEAARWLDSAHLYDVDWLPADRKLLPLIEERIR